MKTLYFDCFAGAGGDMILSSLVSLGVDQERLLEQLKLLKLEGWQIEFVDVDRSGINSKYAQVSVPHEHQHRHLHHIEKIIAESEVSETVKKRAIKIFTRLAEAEARVHGISVEKVHFHEVGAMDAILDVVGACLGFEMLGIERFVASKLHVGSGFVKMAHGNFPVPPPAVVELLKEKDVPIYSTEVAGELLTPTAAAIITTVCDAFGEFPNIKIERTGYGAGTRQYEGFPNVLRLILGESAGDEKQNNELIKESLVLLETNIDDDSAENLSFVQELAMEKGARDCWLTGVLMKKSRAATTISILCRKSESENFVKFLLTETTTLGIRIQEIERISLPREMVRVETSFGEIELKVARIGDQIKAAPEYEQCRAAALKFQVPLRDVIASAKMAFELTKKR